MGLLSRFKSMVGGRLDVSSRYALLREAISGTMSKFYMARDLETRKIVGLKILDSEKTAAFEARFKGVKKPTEGEIAASLEHPNIVETYDHGTTTKGEQYLVMEYLEGADLNSLLIGRDDRLEGRRVRFIREAAQAIAAVHEAGYLHRDICPRNIFLTKDGEHIKLIDFGLTIPATKPFMLPGNRTGTPNYMAPELVRRKPTDSRVDVFAFGITAYEICTYELPWPRGATGMAALTHDQPATDIRKYRPKINPVLAKAIHACIQCDPQRRCPSIEAFLQAIRHIKTIDLD